MLTLNQVAIKLNDVRNFRGLLEVYEDLAAQKMTKIRDEISGFRDYAKTLTQMSSELEEDIASVIKKNEKQKAVLLVSSDKGLYGRAFDVVGMQFSKYVSENKVDAFVVGSLGVDVISRSGMRVNYTEIASTEEALAGLWKTLSEYQEINVYYLKYISLANQSAEVLHVSGDLIPKETDTYQYDEKNKLKYIYEPSAIEVAEVFAKEVLVFLTSQTLKEADLAKHAARLMYLDSCLQRNNENLNATMKQKMILTKRRSNKRQNARIVNYMTRNRSNQYA